MDICHLKKITEVLLRGDIEKVDSGAYAVFTEQGSSASQMTAAKIMEVVARLLNCDGQVADAVSAYTQVKLEDSPRLLKIPKSECSDACIRLPRHKLPTSSATIEDPVVLIERNLYGHPLAGDSYGKHNVCSFIGNKGCFCQCVWMTSKWLESSRNMAPM